MAGDEGLMWAAVDSNTGAAAVAVAVEAAVSWDVGGSTAEVVLLLLLVLVLWGMVIPLFVAIDVA